MSEYGVNKRILTSRGQGMFAIPTQAIGVNVATSASANTYGSWVQLTAGLDFQWFLWAITIALPSTVLAADSTYNQIQLGKGPASSEIPISVFRPLSQDYLSSTGKPRINPFWLPWPLLIPKGERVCARMAANVASAATYRVGLTGSREDDMWRAP